MSIESLIALVMITAGCTCLAVVCHLLRKDDATLQEDEHAIWWRMLSEHNEGENFK